MSKSFRKEDVVGKTVIETSGVIKGRVKDVIFNLNSTITIIVEGADGKDAQIPLAKVTGISDHVVVRSDPTAVPTTSSSGASCKFCGTPIKLGETWCPSCGKSQS